MAENDSTLLAIAKLQEGSPGNCVRSERDTVGETGAEADIGGAFDRESFLANIGEDPEFAKEISELFISCYPELMIQLREGIQANDASRSRSAAHQLKGMVANFAAKPAVELLRKMEELAKNGDLQSIQRLYYDLDLQMSRLKLALARVILSPTSPAEK